ncbi:pseudoazurin [Paracoccus sp. DMF-8]|uniref:pseudoazurin n=1 Tax=Paracoccus sp. DMF-8 TaxID=3019445 RepID=UPI0023E84A44|nr:pseudoazurin [Paracoccus sp. DMF-8]MDF3605228.1 pseudoazurin [Paracoccus sp. DMF-8]
MKPIPLALAALFALPAWAEVHEVRMLNRNDQGPMIYEPQFLRIAPGDSVRFLPTQPGHNAATIDEMLPEGAAPFRSKINQEFGVAFDIPGTYGIKCSPHYAMGMVMVVQVGDDAVATIPEGLPKRAADRFQSIVEGVE